MKNIFITLFLSASFAVLAQGFQCKPNACTVKTTGNYQVELAGCNNYMDIYILNSSSEPVRGVPITGMVDFLYLDETYLSAELIQYYRTNSLRAKIPAPGFYNCRISLNINGDQVTVYFDNECDLRAEKKQPATIYR